MFGEGEPVPDKISVSEAESERIERLQGRRDYFFNTLKTICESEAYNYKEITGSDSHEENEWIEYRFLPLKN